MKYCPYCGAALLDSAAPFCSECGKPVPTASQPQKEAPVPDAPVYSEPEPDPKDGYDGYYDDVRPADNGHEKARLDPALVKRICLVAGGAALVIGLAILMMLLL